MHRLPVRQIMTPDVVSIGPDRLVADAAETMEAHRVRHLPVVDDDGFVIGIVTDSDIREAETAGSVLNSYEPQADSRWLTVADVMTTDLVTVSLDATVGELAAILVQNKVGGAPVVVADAVYPNRLRLAGIVTETDIFTTIASAWTAESEGSY